MILLLLRPWSRVIKKVLKPLHRSQFINYYYCHVWIPFDQWTASSSLSHPSFHCLQVPRFHISLYQEYFQQWVWEIRFLYHFNPTCSCCLFHGGLSPLPFLFLWAAFHVCIIFVRITVDGSHDKQGENDKSQQDESCFQICEWQLHELLMLFHQHTVFWSLESSAGNECKFHPWQHFLYPMWSSEVN